MEPGKPCWGCIHFKSRCWKYWCRKGMHSQPGFNPDSCPLATQGDGRVSFGVPVSPCTPGEDDSVKRDLSRIMSSPGEPLPSIPLDIWKRESDKKGSMPKWEDRQRRLETGVAFSWRDSDPDPGTIEGWIREILKPTVWRKECNRRYRQRKAAMKALAEVRPIKFS